jgi:flagellar basal body-associated protein FliL
VNFLIKIEEAINRFIEQILEKLKTVTPDFLFQLIVFLAHLPAAIKKKIKIYKPKLHILGLKFVGYSAHYTTMARGYLMSFLMYLRSEEFKKADKTTLLLKPIRYAKSHPIKTLSGLFSLMILAGATTIIFQNAEKIAIGTYALRKPASSESAEEDVYIEFKNHKFEVKIQAAGGGGHGGHGAEGAEAHEYELYLDLRIEANNPQDKEFLERMEEMLDDNLEALELPVTQLPLGIENQKAIEEAMVKSLNEDFRQIGHDHPIKGIKLKQILPSRPQYFRQAERMTSVADINLQIFLEDTHRNRQVWLDFSVLASNRNVILYLKDHEVELKDHLTTNVEPVIPQLPVEDEGRLIIKEKLRSEINQFLEKNGIEGKILEIYIDYLMVS